MVWCSKIIVAKKYLHLITTAKSVMGKTANLIDLMTNYLIAVVVIVIVKVVVGRNAFSSIIEADADRFAIDASIILFLIAFDRLKIKIGFYALLKCSGLRGTG